MIYVDDIQHCNPGVSAEVHLALRRPAPHRGRLARPHPHLRSARPQGRRGHGRQPLHRERRSSSRSPTCSPTAPTPTTSATSSAAATDAFKASYLENAVTSNAALAPLANKSQKDIRSFIRMAETGQRDGISFRGQLLVAGGRGNPLGDHEAGHHPRSRAAREPGIHPLRRAGRRIPHRAAVPAAGIVSQHEPPGRKGRRHHERRRGARDSSSITTAANRRRSPPAPRRISSSSRNSSAI